MNPEPGLPLLPGVTGGAAGRVAYVGLGANLGDAVATMAWAVGQLAAYPGTRVLRCSSLYRSAPVDAEGPDFFNAVVEVFTTMPSPDLICQLLKTEQMAGRERPWKNAPRTLDMDLLVVGDERWNTDSLTLPHPRMLQRAFVLLPLAELDPAWRQAAAAPGVAAQRIERIDHPLWKSTTQETPCT